MDRDIALDLLEQELKRLRAFSYEELLKLKDSTNVINGPDGKQYQIERQAFLDDKLSHDLRVMVCVDDGGFNALRPLTRSFIISPSGKFIERAHLGFRLALGGCNCRQKTMRNALQPACAEILARLEKLRVHGAEQLAQLPAIETEQVVLNGVRVRFNTYRGELQSGRTLIVVQALIRTLRWPTYISFDMIGHVLAEGFVVSSNGLIEEAPDKIMWDYR